MYFCSRVIYEESPIFSFLEVCLITCKINETIRIGLKNWKRYFIQEGTCTLDFGEKLHQQVLLRGLKLRQLHSNILQIIRNYFVQVYQMGLRKLKGHRASRMPSGVIRNKANWVGVLCLGDLTNVSVLYL